MNPWGVVLAIAGGVAIYIGARGTQGRVWQMVTGNTALSSSTEAKGLKTNQTSGAFPMFTQGA